MDTRNSGRSKQTKDEKHKEFRRQLLSSIKDKLPPKLQAEVAADEAASLTSPRTEEAKDESFEGSGNILDMQAGFGPRQTDDPDQSMSFTDLSLVNSPVWQPPSVGGRPITTDPFTVLEEKDDEFNSPAREPTTNRKDDTVVRLRSVLNSSARKLLFAGRPHDRSEPSAEVIYHSVRGNRSVYLGDSEDPEEHVGGEYDIGLGPRAAFFIWVSTKNALEWNKIRGAVLQCADAFFFLHQAFETSITLREELSLTDAARLLGKLESTARLAVGELIDNWGKAEPARLAVLKGVHRGDWVSNLSSDQRWLYENASKFPHRDDDLWRRTLLYLDYTLLKQPEPAAEDEDATFNRGDNSDLAELEDEMNRLLGLAWDLLLTRIIPGTTAQCQTLLARTHLLTGVEEMWALDLETATNSLGYADETEAAHFRNESTGHRALMKIKISDLTAVDASLRREPLQVADEVAIRRDEDGSPSALAENLLGSLRRNGDRVGELLRLCAGAHEARKKLVRHLTNWQIWLESRVYNDGEVLDALPICALLLGEMGIRGGKVRTYDYAGHISPAVREIQHSLDIYNPYALRDADEVHELIFPEKYFTHGTEGRSIPIDLLTLQSFYEKEKTGKFVSHEELSRTEHTTTLVADSARKSQQLAESVLDRTVSETEGRAQLTEFKHELAEALTHAEARPEIVELERRIAELEQDALERDTVLLSRIPDAGQVAWDARLAELDRKLYEERVHHELAIAELQTMQLEIRKDQMKAANTAERQRADNLQRDKDWMQRKLVEAIDKQIETGRERDRAKDQVRRLQAAAQFHQAASFDDDELMFAFVDAKEDDERIARELQEREKKQAQFEADEAVARKLARKLESGEDDGIEMRRAQEKADAAEARRLQQEQEDESLQRKQAQQERTRMVMKEWDASKKKTKEELSDEKIKELIRKSKEGLQR